MPGRASALLILGLALPACHRDGPEDPAIAAPGAGIPMGAVGAVGAAIDTPAGARIVHPPPMPAVPPRKSARPLPTPLPPDPFADPPGDAGAPVHPHPSKGTTL